MRARSAAAMLAAACTFCACALETVKPPTLELPTAFEQQPANAPAPVPDASVFSAFRSEELDRLVALAKNGNLDILASVARVRQADARARQAGAALLPRIDANGNATLFTGRSGGSSAHEVDWSALLSASYEVDFWGKNRAAGVAAKALAGASRAELETVNITALSGVANTYFQILSLRERTELARLNLASARSVLQVVEARYEAGRTSPSELATQRAAVASAELLVPHLEQQELEALGALALLVGEIPEGFQVQARALDALAEPVIGAGLPSDLLRRRPDLVAAENGLVAAHADLSAARAALFPALSLTLNGGIQNPAVQAAVITLAGTGPSLTIGAALVQSIFDAGRHRAVIDEAAGREEELIAAYRNAILAALVDVENALGQIRNLDLQEQPQAESVAQSERAFQAADRRYREGSGQFLAVLDAQRTLYAAREQFSEYRLSRLQAMIGLFRALGGGWQGPGAQTNGIHP